MDKRASGRGLLVGAFAPGVTLVCSDQLKRRKWMAAGDRSGGGIGGISLGGILVIIGIVVMIVASFWIGLIILLVGLIAFGGFARGKWY
jgi:hypothetical protein